MSNVLRCQRCGHILIDDAELEPQFCGPCEDWYIEQSMAHREWINAHVDQPEKKK